MTPVPLQTVGLQPDSRMCFLAALGGLRAFHQKSTCLAQLTSEPGAVRSKLGHVTPQNPAVSLQRRLLITELIQEDSPFCLTRAITRL